MLYIKIQPQSFLGSEEEDFNKYFYRILAWQHLVQWRGTIRTNCHNPFDRRPHVKSGEHCSSVFKEKDI